jgi:integrase
MKFRHVSQRRDFVAAFPDLAQWFDQHLEVRVGRLHGTSAFTPEHPASFWARQYLYYLAFTDRLRLDYGFLLSVSPMYAVRLADALGVGLGISNLRSRQAAMGYHQKSQQGSTTWVVSRIALHTGKRAPELIDSDDLAALNDAISAYVRTPLMQGFHGHSPEKGKTVAQFWHRYVRQTQLVLHHIGNSVPRPRMSPGKRREHVYPHLEMGVVVERWLKVKRTSLSTATVDHCAVSLRRFIDFLMRYNPTIETFADITADVMTDFLIDLRTQVAARTGRTLSITAQRARALHVAQFLNECAAWEWPDFPTRPVLNARDLPRLPQRLPRYIPSEQLGPIMKEVRKLTCCFQRAAILTARWSGARRSEIARLPVDCLDAYPDGTPRLRIPAGKTNKERLVPLHPEAADALRQVIARRAASSERPVPDTRTGQYVKLLFYRRGVAISPDYLFNYPLTDISRRLGLVDDKGHSLITTHRFRHTVGTELAEGGARLQTIMDVLGHQSPHMSMVYIRVSDEAVLADYRSVLKPDAPIAGPAAEIIRNQRLPQSTVDWLKSNFLKTELELGHCLRLPEEGPCECDLYLNCAKFVTTRAYVPRLRARHRLELNLTEDARSRGWTREIERHSGIASRIEQLLADLGEPGVGTDSERELPALRSSR